MKKAKLEAVLRRKVRIRITRRKRGRFRIILPADLSQGTDAVKYFPRKTEALTWLFTKLRLIQPMIICVDCVGESDVVDTEKYLKLTGRLQ